LRGDVHVGNEQLRQALRNAGLEVDDLAVKAEVDVKTVRRWVGGRTPRARYRRRVADTLGVSEQLLWPGEVPDHEQAEDTAVETVELFTAGDAPDWRELLADAQERVDLLDLTLGDVITDGDEQLLAAAAARGCRVRVLISDPDSIHLAIAEQDAGRHVSLTSRPAAVGELDRVAGLLSPLVERGEVELRKFVDAGTCRVLVFDDQALVHLRLAGVDADAMPVLYLARESIGEIFESFTQHFRAVWQRSEPLH
jgi:lambda repressor-like predicted transcriptional regulator